MWTLRPRAVDAPTEDIEQIAEVADEGNVPDENGFVSPHSASELFQHVLHAASLGEVVRLPEEPRRPGSLENRDGDLG